MQIRFPHAGIGKRTRLALDPAPVVHRVCKYTGLRQWNRLCTSEFMIGFFTQTQKTSRPDLYAAPVVLHVCTYADPGRALSSYFDENHPVHQVQVVHGGDPSILDRLHEFWSPFLQNLHDDTFATRITGCRCRCIVSSEEDEDDIGVVPERFAFYVPGPPICMAAFLFYFVWFCL